MTYTRYTRHASVFFPDRTPETLCSWPACASHLTSHTPCTGQAFASESELQRTSLCTRRCDASYKSGLLVSTEESDHMSAHFGTLLCHETLDVRHRSFSPKIPGAGAHPPIRFLYLYFVHIVDCRMAHDLYSHTALVWCVAWLTCSTLVRHSFGVGMAHLLNSVP